MSGRTDPSMPCFTAGGSFWTTTSELPSLAPEADPRRNSRNVRYIHSGYESLALIPLRSGGEEIIGLWQLNDRKKGGSLRT